MHGYYEWLLPMHPPPEKSVDEMAEKHVSELQCKPRIRLNELTYALAYPFAIMAVHGEIGPRQLQESILHDAEVLRISKATELVDDEHYTRISIDKRWADVTLYLKDGREIQSPARTPRGDPDNPLSDQEISDKFHLLADEIIGAPRARDIERRVAQVCGLDFDLDAWLFLIFAAPE